MHLTSVSQLTLLRLARLALPGRFLTGLYAVLCGLVTIAAYYDIQQSIERQPDRVPYAVVMYAAFDLLFFLSAIRTWQAASALVKVQTAPSESSLERALKLLRDMLLLFFSWSIFLIGVGLVAFLMPAY